MCQAEFSSTFRSVMFVVNWGASPARDGWDERDDVASSERTRTFDEFFADGEACLGDVPAKRRSIRLEPSG